MKLPIQNMLGKIWALVLTNNGIENRRKLKLFAVFNTPTVWEKKNNWSNKNNFETKMCCFGAWKIEECGIKRTIKIKKKVIFVMTISFYEKFHKFSAFQDLKNYGRKTCFNGDLLSKNVTK